MSSLRRILRSACLLWPEALILAAVGLAFHATLAGSAHIPFDAEFFHFPLLRAVQQQLSSGNLPAWEPFSYGGSPLLANAQSAWLYPPHLLLDGILAILGKPLTEHTLDVVAVAHVAVAGLGTAAVVRARRLGPAAAAFAGIFVVLNGATVSQAEHLGMTETFAWLPLAVLVIDRIQEHGVSARRVVMLAIFFALMITAGFLPLILACAVLLIGSALIKWPGGLRALKGAIAGMALGGALAGAMLVPILAVLGVFPPLEAHAALPVADLVTSVFPNAFGHWQPSISEYVASAGGLTNAYYYVGTSALVLLPLALTSGRQALREAALVGVLLLATFGATGAAIASAIQPLPTIGPLWRPEDLVYVAMLPLALLLARGLSRAPSVKQIGAVALTVAVFCLITFSGGAGHALHLLSDAPRRSLLALGLIGAALVAALVMHVSRHSARGVAIALALAAVVAGAELASAVPSRYFVNSSGPATSAGPNSTGDGSAVLAALRKKLAPAERVAVDVDNLSPPWAGFPPVWHLPDINGFQPQFSKYQLARVEATRADFEGRNRTFPITPEVLPYLEELNARYIVVSPAHDPFAGSPRYALAYQDSLYRVYRITGRETRAYAVGAACVRARGSTAILSCRTGPSVQVSVTGTATRSLQLSSPSDDPLWVVTGEPWYPGWHASVSGRSLSVKRVGYLAVVAVPPGATAVKVSYHVPGLVLGCIVSLLAFIGSLLALLWRRRAKAKADERESRSNAEFRNQGAAE